MLSLILHRLKLQELHGVFRQHISEMTVNEYRKEMERLGIDLSWKSSQIEGNTYSLLETERLLRESVYHVPAFSVISVISV